MHTLKLHHEKQAVAGEFHATLLQKAANHPFRECMQPLKREDEKQNYWAEMRAKADGTVTSAEEGGRLCTAIRSLYVLQLLASPIRRCRRRKPLSRLVRLIRDR